MQLHHSAGVPVAQGPHSDAHMGLRPQHTDGVPALQSLLPCTAENTEALVVCSGCWPARARCQGKGGCHTACECIAPCRKTGASHTHALVVLQDDVDAVMYADQSPFFMLVFTK